MTCHLGSACLLLLVLPPLTLSLLQCNETTPKWPHCLSRSMNGTYYIRPESSEVTSCPAHPCLTLPQLTQHFFVENGEFDHSNGPIGNTTIVFLPGMHTLNTVIAFFGRSTSHFLTLTGLENYSLNTVIRGNDTVIGRHGIEFRNILFAIRFLQFKQAELVVNSCKNIIVDHSIFEDMVHVEFEDITSVNISHVQFTNSTLNVDNSISLILEHTVFDDTWLYIRSVESVSLANMNITITPTADTKYCSNSFAVITLLTSHESASIRNVVLSTAHLPCGKDIPLLYATGGGHMSIIDSTFVGMHMAKHIEAYPDTRVTISGSCRFENGSPAIFVEDGTSIHLEDSIIFKGCNTAIQSINSLVTLAGNISFLNNSGYEGGAISLIDTTMTIAVNSHIVFRDNHASHVGGAIYSSDNGIINYVSAAVYKDPCTIILENNVTVEFINNKAESGGNAMYGITLSKMVCGARVAVSYEDFFPVHTVLSFEPDEASTVSSDPLRICICPDQRSPDCLAVLPRQNIPQLDYTVFPGQDFTIAVAVVGFNFALTSGSVYTQFLNSDATLGSDSQNIQGVNQTGCSRLEYSVHSSNKQEALLLKSNSRNIDEIPSGVDGDIQAVQYDNLLTVGSSNYVNPTPYFKNGSFATNMTDGVFGLAGYIPRSLQDIPVIISVKLLDCPPGFTLSNTHKCECNERVLEYSLTCNINDQTVHRDGTTWINSVNSSTYNGVIVHHYCPFGYCKQEQVDVNLTNPDTQCAFDRSGTLCGACKPNLSLALGGSQCLPNCSNSYLSLLLLFAVAGFALVFFINILNLTVTQGTMNGLIFYANIVAANQSILIPENHNKFLSFLSIFVSWLNLDLGIQTCFFKGLDGYWKTWLQFLFPFYVWAIAGGIILVSHYSMRATKIFGKSSLSVLATLFLLSYAKLFRSLITIFSFATLLYPDNSTSTVWAFDGNIRYFSTRHIFLFLFGVFIVLVLWLPYNVVLLSAQWLRTQAHRRGLRWLKPFLDAYYGPFKDKHHYWVGVLLVVREVLFGLFAYFYTVENNFNLLVTSVACIILVAWPSVIGRLYKKSYLSALENSFFLNLGVLAAGTLYLKYVGGNQEALVTVSIGIVFLQFVAIIGFHACYFVLIPVRNRCKDFAKSRSEEHAHHGELQPILNFDSSDSDFEDEDRQKPVVTHSEVCLTALRKEENRLLQLDTDVDSRETSQIRSVEMSGNHQPPTAEVERNPFTISTGETLDQTHHIGSEQNEQCEYVSQSNDNSLLLNGDASEVLIPLNDDTSCQSSYIERTDYMLRASNAASISIKPEATSEPLDELASPMIDFQQSSRGSKHCAAERHSTLSELPNPEERSNLVRESTAEDVVHYEPPQETNQHQRYYAAERDDRFIDFVAPRETLLEYTQYHLPEERKEPGRESTAERVLLRAPQEPPRERNAPSRYFAAKRESLVDFSAPREPLLDFLNDQ